MSRKRVTMTIIQTTFDKKIGSESHTLNGKQSPGPKIITSSGDQSKKEI